jgi:MerR-like DNA binding protein
MDEPQLWTLDQLTQQVERALAVDYGGAANGRIRSVPDQRAIRWYTSIGLVDRPLAMRGRTALYGERHLAQLVAIKRRQAAGLTLTQVQEEMAGATDVELRLMAQLPIDPPVISRDMAARMDVRRFWATRPAPAGSPTDTDSDEPQSDTSESTPPVPAHPESAHPESAHQEPVDPERADHGPAHPKSADTKSADTESADTESIDMESAETESTAHRGSGKPESGHQKPGRPESAAHPGSGTPKSSRPGPRDQKTHDHKPEDQKPEDRKPRVARATARGPIHETRWFTGVPPTPTVEVEAGSLGHTPPGAARKAAHTRGPDDASVGDGSAVSANQLAAPVGGAVGLGGGVVLVLPTIPDHAEVTAIERAAAPLLAELTRLGLVPPGVIEIDQREGSI